MPQTRLGEPQGTVAYPFWLKVGASSLCIAFHASPILLPCSVAHRWSLHKLATWSPALLAELGRLIAAIFPQTARISWLNSFLDFVLTSSLTCHRRDTTSGMSRVDSRTLPPCLPSTNRLLSHSSRHLHQCSRHLHQRKLSLLGLL